MNEEWIRIPAAIDSEQDRRAVVSVLVAFGLSVRCVKVRETTKGPYKKFIEYRV